MNWSETPYPAIAVVVGLVTLMHCFSNHRRAWISRISALSLMIALVTTIALGGSEGVGTSGFAFWVVVVGMLGFAGLSVINVLVAVYDFVQPSKTTTDS